MARSVVSTSVLDEIGGDPSDPVLAADKHEWMKPSDTELAVRHIVRKAEAARRDMSLFYDFVIRHELTKRRLIAAPHQRLMFDFMAYHEWCVIRLPVGTGKCVSGNTLVVHQRTGVPITIRELIEDDSVDSVLTFANSGIDWGAVSGKYSTGRKKCLRIFLRSGRTIETTPEHPYLTIHGWVPTSNINIGETVAVAASIPPPSQRSNLSDSEIVLLAILFAEGSLTGEFVGFSTGDERIVELATSAANDIGCDVKYRSRYDYRIVKRCGKYNPASTLVSKHGLRCLAKKKRIPKEIFSLSNEKLAKFLSIVWACDGSVFKHGASIVLASEGGIDDIQHLLLRFGIQSTKRFKPVKSGEKLFDSWRLSIRADSLSAFSSMAQILWGHKRENLDRLLSKRRNPNEGMAIADVEFQRDFVERFERSGCDISQLKSNLGWNNHLSLTDVCFGSGNRGGGRRGLSCGFAEAVKMAEFDELAWICDGSVYWDEVISIEDAGVLDVFDLTVPDTSCFLANNIIAHNTFGMAASALWMLGNDVTQRGAIVSKTQNQATKPLSMISDYITEPALNAPLTVVFPWLQKSPRTRDPWTTTSITVDRDPGIRDASVVAAGYESTILGSRLSWLVTDDLVDDENSASPHMREAVRSKFYGRFVSRMDPYGSRVVVCNTPWHRFDQTYHLENDGGWPTITMDVYGYIRFTNADSAWLRRALDTHIRPSTTRVGDSRDWYRLRAHDPDPEEEVPLWPERYSVERIKEIRYGSAKRGGMLPHEFARLFLCEPFDEDAGRCQRSWIEACKQRGMGMTLVESYDGSCPTYTGLDLGVGENKQHDETVFFTFALEIDGSRRLLDIDGGRMTGPDIIRKIIDKTTRYRSALRVENNSAQDFIRQFAIEEKKDLKIKAHTTTRVNKIDKDFGVESIFMELQNTAWIIPCDADGKCHPEVQKWLDELLYYQPPPAHTGNRLMASWFAREAARLGHSNDPKPRSGKQREMVAQVGF